MPTIENLRPGIYSSYTIDSVYAAPRSRLAGAVAVKAEPAMAGFAYQITSVDYAVELFGDNDANTRILAAVKLLLESGVSKVVAVTLGSSLADGLAILREESGIGALVCDAETPQDAAALKAYLADCAKSRREQVAFMGRPSSAAALALAGGLNDERAVVCCSGAAYRGLPADALYPAAAIAGVMLAVSDPVHNWNGHPLPLLDGCSRLTEAEVQSLLAGGVTPMEERGGEVTCIRALTTRTSNNGVPERSLASLNTILIVDDVIRGVRDSLEARLRGTRLSLETVRTQVTVELSAKRDAGIIEGFSVPNVRVHSADPSVCVVELAFKAAHVLSQIHITAFVRV